MWPHPLCIPQRPSFVSAHFYDIYVALLWCVGKTYVTRVTYLHCTHYTYSLRTIVILTNVCKSWCNYLIHKDLFICISITTRMFDNMIFIWWYGYHCNTLYTQENTGKLWLFMTVNLAHAHSLTFHISGVHTSQKCVQPTNIRFARRSKKCAHIKWITVHTSQTCVQPTNTRFMQRSNKCAHIKWVNVHTSQKCVQPTNTRFAQKSNKCAHIKWVTVHTS